MNASSVSAHKLVVILGPTASGKSDLAVRLAKEFDGEIISADSRQVYRGLNIGTGKITKREMAGIPHHILDVASPRRVFTAHEYAELARAAVSLIAARGKLPIVCGGTGFYIDALLGDMPLAPVPPDLELRKNLEKETLDTLFKKLQRLDPARTEKIDAKNRHRLIRALEIARAQNYAEQTPVPEQISVRGAVRKNAENDVKKREVFSIPLYRVLKIGILMPKEELRERIKKRLMARMKKGMVAEAERLHENGLSWARMESLGLEYRFLARYLQKQTSKQDMLARLETEIWRYAKRQMTWWKRDVVIRWYMPSGYENIKKLCGEFLEPWNIKRES